MKIFTFAVKKIDSKLKPANTDDIRWFVVLVLVDYCLVKVYLAESSALVCIIVFPSSRIWAGQRLLLRFHTKRC